MNIQKYLSVGVLLFLTFAIGTAQNITVKKTAEQTHAFWIYFKDKGPQALLKKQKAEELLSARALQRRLKTRGTKALVEFSDKPLYEPYVRQVKQIAAKIRVQSRWLNAVSVEASQEQLQKISGFAAVAKIAPVRMYRKKTPQPEIRPLQAESRGLAKSSGLDYGSAQSQISIINADALHEKGLSGRGVLIAMLDDGFNLLYTHITFDSLRNDNRIEDTWDFIHQDASVEDHNYWNDGTHGTKTLSVIGGNTPGQLIGTAYGASFLLAKTEMDSTEVQAEEDTWVAGIEWAEQNGADIVSSSLGYGYYATDPASSWYTWEDMDGETAVVTIAADLAVDKGVLVFNSAGNENDNADHNTLSAPADGNKVLAVAAVTSSGTRASFSSVGPTADGRIKPDIAAMGSGVVYASSSYDSLFNSGNGTSFSCPLAAGAAALLLEAFPGTSPEKIQQALRSTASQANAPDKYLGWGIMDAAAAYDYLETNGLSETPSGQIPKHLEIYVNYPNPFNAATRIRYKLSSASRVRVTVFDQNGREVLVSRSFNKAAGLNSLTLHMNRFASGVYYYHIHATEFGSGQRYTKSGKMILLK